MIIFSSICLLMGPLYISEISPKELRGMLTSVFNMMFGFGTICALATNVGFSRFFLGWRIAMTIPASVALVYAIGMVVWMPHTPQ